MPVFAGEARYHIGIWYTVLQLVWARETCYRQFCLQFNMDVLIVRLRSSGFGCYLFGVYFGCLMFADAILLLAHPVSAMRHMLKICDLYAVDYDLKFNSSRRPHDMPRTLQVVLWPFNLESGVRVTCDAGYLCANFSLPRPLCSRFRPNVRDRQTDVRRASSFSAPT